MTSQSFKYPNAVIYEITCKDVNVIDKYIGSCANEYDRRYTHKSKCNNVKSQNHNLSLYVFIRDNGGWDNWLMVVVEKYPCQTKTERFIRERYWQDKDEYKLNSYKAYTSPTEKKEFRKIYDQKPEIKKKIRERGKKLLETPVICDVCGVKSSAAHIKRHQQTPMCRRVIDPVLDAKMKKDKEEHKEKTRLNDKKLKKARYEKHKEEINKAKRKVVKCECGVWRTNGNKLRHFASKTHLKQIGILSKPIDPKVHFVCECGMILNISKKYGEQVKQRHLKSKKHLKDILNLNSVLSLVV